MESALRHFCERIRAAAATATPLRIVGGGTKDFYAQQLQGDLLQTRAYTGITSYEPSELVVTVRAGTLLSELEATLAAQHQYLGFEAPHFGNGSTLGGIVASGLSGPSRASVGAVRDFVLGLSFINGRGEHLTFGGQVMKNVAGYDVSRLMVGALGTLGLITEVSLKVLPFATAQATLRFEASQKEALALLHTLGAQPLPLNASTWLEENGVGVLYLRLQGAQAAVATASQQLGGECITQHAGLGLPIADFWQACRNQLLPFFEENRHCDLWRLSVPQTTAPFDFQQSSSILADTLKLAPLIEWHGAQRWYYVEPNNHQAALALRAKVAQAGGSATLFKRASKSKQDAALNLSITPHFDTLAKPVARINQALKHQFDPAKILNRGRLYEDW